MKEILSQHPIIPVLTVGELEHALSVADIFLSHGIKIIEVTLRTPQALSIIDALVCDYPQMLIGAGTVLNRAVMTRVCESRAQFVVSPGLSSELIDLARSNDMLYLPGITTVSEAMQALTLGVDCLKFFPAKLSGGTAMLKTMAQIMPQLSFCPTGGIDMSNYRDYLECPNVLAVGMSALAPPSLLEAGNWQGIARRCRMSVIPVGETEQGSSA